MLAIEVKSNVSSITGSSSYDVYILFDNSKQTCFTSFMKVQRNHRIRIFHNILYIISLSAIHKAPPYAVMMYMFYYKLILHLSARCLKM